MVRCFALHDVYSQPQHSARQRRQEIMNERRGDDSTHGYSDFDGNEMLDTEVPDTQENEEVYRVNLDDDSHPSNEFTHDAVGINIGRGEQRGRRGSSSHSSGRRGGSLDRSGGSSGANVGSGSRGSQRKQSFETTMQETITGFRDFQRQSLQQLLPGAFDQDDYDEWKKAEALFLDLQRPSGMIARSLRSDRALARLGRYVTTKLWLELGRYVTTKRDERSVAT
ncbi:hypothetical protein YC2023_054175 [Brassica napus]